MNSGAPSSCSSSRIASDTAGWATCSASAAAVKPPCSATATNSRSRRRSIGRSYGNQQKHVLDFWLPVRCDRGVPDPLILLAGAVAGAVFGLFGAGGAAFATPMLALAGVPGAIAVATPLPALLPASVLSARRQVRAGNLDTRLAGLVVAGGVPGAVLGALGLGWLSGHALLRRPGACSSSSSALACCSPMPPTTPSERPPGGSGPRSWSCPPSPSVC